MSFTRRSRAPRPRVTSVTRRSSPGLESAMSTRDRVVGWGVDTARCQPSTSGEIASRERGSRPRCWDRRVARPSLARSSGVPWAPRVGCPPGSSSGPWSATTGPEPTESSSEAYVSAQRPPPCQEARLPCPHEHSCRPCRDQVASRQGPGPPLGLIERFRTRSEFDRLRRSGIRVRAGTLRCTYLHDPTGRPTRVAFAVPRSAGNAVRRNRFRRRARAVLVACDLPPGWVLIRADRAAVELSSSDLSSDLHQLVVKMSRRVATNPSPTPSPAPSGGWSE